MIASFSLGLIFIKTRKTAGTSAEIVLSSWCSGDDIVTTISGVDELARQKLNGRARNFSDDPTISSKFIRLVEAGDPAAIQQFRKSNRSAETYYNHMPATKVRALLPGLWASAHKITVERHPYDRALSAGWWAARDNATDDISDQIDRAIEARIFPNWPLYTEQSRLLVDEIIRYDRLWERIDEMRKGLGKPELAELPQAKAHHRKDRRPAADVLSSIQKDRIYERTALEFELVGFER